jgi:N6-adenosine-specific RNA methylase IME4
MRPTKYLTDEARTQARVQYNQRYHARRKARAKYDPLPSGPYRILYADPPWFFHNEDPNYHGHARDKYPTLTIPELCALPVRRLRAPKAVLFLWVPSGILAECFAVLTAWGFQYKTNYVWDKERTNYGYYHNNRHELLLVATHGGCKPDRHTLEDSIRRIPRGEQHSAKPEEYRLLIDALYPEGRRLELFARRRVKGWDAWGNQLVLGSTPEEQCPES